MRFRLPWIVLLLAAACSGDGNNAPPADQAYSISLGGPQTDTIDALLPLPVIAQVTRAGRPAAGIQVVVRVAGCTSQCTTIALETGAFHAQIAVKTDSNGQVPLWVRLGRVKGPALIVAGLADGSLADSTTMQVLAGAPDTLLVGPLDTAIVLDSGFSLSAHVVDRGGNVLLVPVDVVHDAERLLRDGDWFSARDYGLGFIQASAVSGLRQWVTFGYVAVVPPGRLVLSNANGTVQVANTDGSGRRVLGPAGATGGGWSPDGSRVAYSGSQAQLLVQRDLAHGDLILTASTGPLAEMISPAYSLADDWVYFAGWPKRDNSDGNQASWEIWRVHSDGRGLARVGEAGLNADADFAPSPSPDGNRVAWVTSRGGVEGLQQLVVHELSSGLTVNIAGAKGFWPSWSPTADSIAYLRPDASGQLSLMLVDVTGGTPRNIAPDWNNFRYTQMGWSPDGQWIVATTWEEPMSVVLVRVRDGLVVRLPWARSQLTGSSWAAGRLP